MEEIATPKKKFYRQVIKTIFPATIKTAAPSKMAIILSRIYMSPNKCVSHANTERTGGPPYNPMPYDAPLRDTKIHLCVARKHYFEVNRE
jgi:hypothetical protein